MTGEYQIAMIALAALGLLMSIELFVGGITKNVIKGQQPGREVQGTQDDYHFRAVRSSLNGVESLPGFLLSSLVLILLNAPAWWVNWGIAAYVAVRYLYSVSYHLGLGIRPLFFALGITVSIVLGVSAVYFGIMA